MKRGWGILGLLFAGAALNLPAQALPDTPGEALWETSLAQASNAARAERKKCALQPDPTGDLIARQHARDIAAGRIPFGHDGFQARTAAWAQAVPGLKAFGENVHRNCGVADPVDTTVEAWKNSRPHRRNLLGDFQRVGSGVARNDKGEWVFVQLYAK